MMHQEGENFTAQQSAVISCLALMGGFDGRPRIGGLVSLQEERGGSNGGSAATTARAVVCGVTRHGKLAVQLLGDSRQRKVRGWSRNQFRVLKIIVIVLFLEILCQFCRDILTRFREHLLRRTTQYLHTHYSKICQCSLQFC
jgi:hypothetical protein